MNGNPLLTMIGVYRLANAYAQGEESPRTWRAGMELIAEQSLAATAQLNTMRLLPRSLPVIVCLCGSTRFMDAFHEANRLLSLEGKIVLTVEIVTYDGADDPQRADPEQKRRLDELHLRKIDLANEVLVLNVGGYIGESTRAEIAYANMTGKTIRWWEQPDCQHCGVPFGVEMCDVCQEAKDDV